MFRCPTLSRVLGDTTSPEALAVAWWDAWLTLWEDLNLELRRKYRKLLKGYGWHVDEDEGSALDAPGRDMGGAAADSGGAGE